MNPRSLQLLPLGIGILVLAAGCSIEYGYDGPPCHLAPVYYPAPQPSPTAWQPETVRAYTLGRAVDPRDANVVHEAHTIYRREETPRPNLTPPTAIVTPQAAKASTNVSNLLRDALTAELNQQRSVSQALTQEAKALNERLAQLNAQSQDLNNSLQDAARLRAQLSAITNRLEAIETQLRGASTNNPYRAGSRP